jgi:hypothetical protein
MQDIRNGQAANKKALPAGRAGLSCLRSFLLF